MSERNDKEKEEQIEFIGHYEYEEKPIGKGGFSTVYIGTDGLTGETVALKIIKGKDLENANSLGFIESEIKALTYLKGKPNIVEFFECIHHCEEQCLVSELCEKGSLKNLLKNEQLTEKERMDYIFQINTGFQELAKAKIIHRDLKPGNILVNDDGEVKIGDFGFAMFEKNKKDWDRIRVGSAFYMAPEVLKNFQYSIKSDIWSLGVTFYQILTGKKPWSLKNSRQIYGNIEKSLCKDYIFENEQITPEMMNIIKRMLTYNVNERISPEQLNQALQSIKNKQIKEKFPDKDAKITFYVKKLLCSIDYCRINYYILKIISYHEKNYSDSEFSRYFQSEHGQKFKAVLIQIIFQQLDKASALKYFSNSEKQSFQSEKQYLQLTSIISNYRQKYHKEFKNYQQQKDSNAIEETLKWFHEVISTASPYLMFLVYDYLLVVRSLRKYFLKGNIEHVMKCCEVSQISAKLKEQYFEEVQTHHKKSITQEDFLHLTNKFKAHKI